MERALLQQIILKKLITCARVHITRYQLELQVCFVKSNSHKHMQRYLELREIILRGKNKIKELKQNYNFYRKQLKMFF